MGGCRCFTTDSLPRGYPGQLFGLRRIVELGGYAKRLTIYTGSGPRLGRVIALRPVLGVSLFALYCFEYVLYRVVFTGGTLNSPL